MRMSQIIAEGLKDPKDNPCWKGYKPVGTKKKGGKTVPNCVPKEGIEEAEKKTMSRAAKGNEKYGKDGMKALAKAGREGASEKKLDAIRDKHDNYNESVDFDNPEYNDEAGMAEGNLHTLSRAVNGLLDTIDDNDNLPEWCQEKIAKAEMMLVSVWDYLLSQKEQGIDPSVSESVDELARVLSLSGIQLTEDLSLDEQFDIIEEMVEELAEEHGVDAETIWEDFESVDDAELFESAAWRRKEGKSKKGGLNAKGVASYRRENPGSKLQTAVTTKPSKLKKGSKAAKRRKSFCARMGGVKGPMKKPNGKPTRKALALRKWNC
jgi:hypothetical protein